MSLEYNLKIAINLLVMKTVVHQHQIINYYTRYILQYLPTHNPVERKLPYSENYTGMATMFYPLPFLPEVDWAKTLNLTQMWPMCRFASGPCGLTKRNKDS